MNRNQNIKSEPKELLIIIIIIIDHSVNNNHYNFDYNQFYSEQ